MSVIDFDSLGKVIDIPNDARTLLERSEMEMTLRLNFSFGEKAVSTDLYVVYYDTVRGPAKGGIRISICLFGGAFCRPHTMPIKPG